MENLKNSINEYMNKHDIYLNSGILNINDFGSVSVNLDFSIDVSHIDNIYEVLEKLANYETSIIEDDGYTAIDIFQAIGADCINYIIEYGWVFDENKEKTIKALKDSCDEKMIDDLLVKIDKLNSLGIETITLQYSTFMNEQFENRVNERANDITAGYYDIEESEKLEIKYEILGIQ